jgi:phosphodiesterase/alkaline phosphatase D-like protein
MKRFKASRALLVLIALFLSTQCIAAQYSTIPGSFTCGTGQATGSSHRTMVTLAQAGVGTSSGSSYSSKAGLHHRLPALASPVVAGLDGTATAVPGAEMQVFSVRVDGNGRSSVGAVRVTIADLSAATGVTADEIAELRLYRSSDGTLGSGDARIVSQMVTAVGSAITLSLPSAEVVPFGARRYYLVTAVLNTAVVDGHAFKVGFSQGGLNTSLGGLGAALAASDADRVRVDVVADQLAFAVQPAGAVHGTVLTTPPVLRALDAHGNVDADFGETMMLGIAPSGVLTGNALSAVNGAATFGQFAISGAGEERTLNATTSGGWSATSAAFDVGKGMAVVSLPNVSLEYDRQQKQIGATTIPPGLTVSVTYDDSPTPPVGPGSFRMVATVDDPNYEGTATTFLEIRPPSPPTAAVRVSSLRGNPPLQVTFMDISTGYIDSWELETGDDNKTVFTDRSRAAKATYSQAGTHRAVLKVVGAGGESQTAVEIAVNAAPQVAPIDPVAGLEDQVLAVDLTGKDAEAGTWSVGAFDAGLIARVENEGEIFRFASVADAFGSAEVEIVRTGQTGLSTAQEVRLTWAAVDDPPRIGPDLGEVHIANEDVAIQVGGVAHAVDVDTERSTLAWSVSGFDAQLVAAVSDGPEGVVLTPAADAWGETGAVLRLTDPATGAEDAREVTLRWTSVNDPPQPPAPRFPTDAAVEISLAPTISWEGVDVDGDPLVFDFHLGSGETLELRAADLSEAAYGLTGLQSGTTYVCRLVARDPEGAVGETRFSFTTQADRLPPVIGDLQLSATDQSATLSWTTNEPARCALLYGVEGLSQASPEDGPLEEGHQYEMKELEPATWYQYELSATDAAGNRAAPLAGSFLTLPAPDTTGPQILSGPAVEGLTPESAVIAWTTDEPSTGLVSYRDEAEMPGEEQEATTAGMAQAHRIRLSGLAPGATYFFRVSATDAAGNRSAVRSGTFVCPAEKDLAPPVFVSGPVATIVADMEATVELSTDELTRAQVRFGADEGLSDGRLVAGGEAASSHRVQLTGLTPETVYYYRVLVIDENGNERWSDARSLRTRAAPDLRPPAVLTGPAVEGLTETGATLVLTTGEMAWSQVLLASVAAPENQWLKEYRTLRTSHSLELTRLEGGTEYLYEVRLFDAAGNAAAPIGGQFRTLDEPDRVPPQIVEGPAVEGVSSDGATLAWRTSELTTALLRFGRTPEAKEGRISLDALVREHRIQLTRLEAGVLYYVAVVVQDAQGNASAEARETVATLARPDLEPPLVLTGPAVEGITSTTAVATVRFNEPVELSLRYGPVDDPGSEEIVTVGERRRDHRLELAPLEPATRYYLALQGRDAAGNQGEEKQLAFATEAAPDLASPILLTGPAALGIGITGARIEWSLDEPADAEVTFGASADLSQAQVARDPLRKKVHAVDLTGLSPGTIYFFRVISKDASGNLLTTAVKQLKTREEEDVKPPGIVAGPVAQNVDQTSATIFWRTDEPADARVEYHPLGTPAEMRTESRGEREEEHSVVLTNLEPEVEYRYAVRSRDAKELVSATREGSFRTDAAPDVDPPQLLGQPAVTDLGHERARIQWNTDEPADSQVRYALQGGEERAVTDPTSVQGHDMTLTNLQPGTTYTFRVASSDRRGNGSTWSPVLTFTTPAEPDRTPPQFTRQPIVAGRTEHAVLLNWSTSEPAAATVAYGETAEYELGLRTRLEQRVDHEWQLTGLESERTYHVGIEIVDGSNNGPTSHPDFTVTTLAAPDLSPPVILTGPLVTKTTSTEAVVEWTTDEGADGSVLYGIDALTETAVDAEMRREHQLVLTGLQPVTTYAYVVVSHDAARNDPVHSAQRSFSTRAEPDTRPPTITAGPYPLEVSGARASISWTTDEPATSILDFGASRDYGMHLERGNLVQNHRFELADLTPGSVYHFKVASADMANNRVTTDPAGSEMHSVDHVFTTIAARDSDPPVFIANPFVTWTDRTAVVSWTTDEHSTSRVDWQGGGETDFVEDNDLVRQHSLTLTGLQKRTLYRYRVTSVDAAGNVKPWGDLAIGTTDRAAKILQPPGGSGEFVTSSSPDTRPPTITAGPFIRAKVMDSVTIEWETDEPADSEVRFGETEKLEEKVETLQDVQTHQITLTNLRPGPQKYYYVVSSTDPSGNVGAQATVAVTAAAAEPDLAPPRFTEEPRVVAATSEDAVIGWKTDEAASARIEYGAGDGEILKRQVTDRQTAHQVALTNLQADTEYLARIFATDASQNQTTEPKELHLHTSPLPDLEPPRILSGPEVMSVGEEIAVIEWVTDELADSFVDFDSTPYLGSIVGDPQYTETHRVVLTNLEPAQTYHFRAGSRDRAANKPVVSDVYRFTTLAEADRIPPPPPSSLSVHSGPGTNLLEWESSLAPDLIGYAIYRENGVVFAPLATHVQETYYLDGGLIDGQTYRYRVTALDRQNPANESEPSAVAEGQPMAESGVEPPQILGLEQELKPGQVVVVVQNSASSIEGLSPTYTFQVSTRPDFGDMVARAGGVQEGTGGLTRWRVGRRLDIEGTYWWRTRAFDGRLEGRWSEPVMLLPRDAIVPAMAEDFDGDGEVSFGDFFLFADGFGSANPAFDLDGDGEVGFEDFFVFADSFGQRASNKLQFARQAQVATGSRITVETIAMSPEQVVAYLSLDGVSRLTGYGFSLIADPPVLRYTGLVDSTVLGEDGASLLLIRPEEGRLVFAEHLCGGGAMVTAENLRVGLAFSLSDFPGEIELRIEQGVIGTARGQSLLVENLGTTRVLPHVCALFQNYPNPFNPATTIPLAIPPPVEEEESQSGQLTIYNILGQALRSWGLNDRNPGYRAVVWDGRDANGRPAASGVYLVRMQLGEFEQTRKLVLLR